MKHCQDKEKNLDMDTFVQTMTNMSAEIDLVAQTEQGQLFFEESNLRAIYE